MARKFDMAKIASPESPIHQLTPEAAAKHYSVGPPLMAVAEDFHKIFPKWVEFMNPVFQQDPGDIQADMYAYSLAAVHYDLKHLSLDQ